MSQAPSVTSPSLTFPDLQNALGSLELDLEAELRRYRRTRATDSPNPVYTPSHNNNWQNSGEYGSRDIDVQAETTDASADDSISLPIPESSTAHSPEVERVLEMFRQSGSATPNSLLNIDDERVSPEDYLESSEELLKSIEVEPDASQRKSKLPTWTPLQIGVVSAAVVGCGLLLLPILFPQTVNRAKTAMPSNADTAATPTTAIVTTEPKTVNLASQEFVDLSLDNLSVVNPVDSVAPATNKPQTSTAPVAQAVPTPDANTVAAQPLANPTGRDSLAAALLPPSLRPQPVTPFPLTPQLATSQPQGSGSEIMVTPDGLKVGYYYVIFRNTNPKSVGKARELVKDAFIRTFPVGRAVQMAEVNTEVKAQALVAKFNTEQVTAEIYYHQLSPAPKR